MKVLYYDCFAGISGDMNLGALIDLGVDLEYIKEELKKLNIEEEFSLDISKEVKQGIGGTKAKVILLNEEHHHHGDNEVAHNHHHRNYKEIKEIIDCSSLKDNVKELAIKIFDEVAKAEGKVHGKNSDEVHFHEVGATDSIVDIVSAAICIDFLKPDTIISSPIEVGCGMVKCAHGILPVPAPATTEILKDVPIIVSGNVDFEATTPTGAAILKTLCNDFNYEKNFTIKKVGYGLGEKEGKKIPNVLRVILAENKDLKKEYMIECNVDDMRGEEFEVLMERLFKKGAYDVFFTPIYMKKQRPGTKISVLCSENNIDEIKEVLFINSSTIGLRYQEVFREKLERIEDKVMGKWGNVDVKICAYKGRIIKVKPEYDRCKEIANAKDVSVNEVFLDALRNYKF